MKEKKEVLDHVVGVIIHSYIDISTVKYKEAIGNECSDDKDQTHNSKDSPVEEEEPDSELEGAEDTDVKMDGTDGDKSEDTPKQDDVFRYACELLTLGLIYSEYSDAIKEGDGQRVFRCFKYMLPLFKASNRVNYSCEIFCILAQSFYHQD